MYFQINTSNPITWKVDVNPETRHQKFNKYLSNKVTYCFN